jgi:hypothetical protein
MNSKAVTRRLYVPLDKAAQRHLDGPKCRNDIAAAIYLTLCRGIGHHPNRQQRQSAPLTSPGDSAIALPDPMRRAVTLLSMGQIAPNMSAEPFRLMLRPRP